MLTSLHIYPYREAYLRFMTNVAILLGAPKAYAKIEMTRVLLFEIELAKVTISVDLYFISGRD